MGCGRPRQELRSSSGGDESVTVPWGGGSGMFTSVATTYSSSRCFVFFPIQHSPPTSPLKHFCLNLLLSHWTQHWTHAVSALRLNLRSPSLSLFSLALQPLVGQGLIIEASRSHSCTQHLVGLLWTSDQPVAETSAWQHTTFTRDRHPCHRRGSNSQSREASGCRPRP